jgi:hypothetical protein
MKFPQIFTFNYSSIFDTSREYLYEKRAEIVSKYTFNLENDVELDIGGYLFLRDELGVGNIFSTLRFYTFDNKFFHNISYMYGERNKFLYETNYLINQNLLFDYTYKRKFINHRSKHCFSFFKIWPNNARGNIGLSFNSEKEVGLFFSTRHNYQNVSFNTFFKFKFLDEAKVKFKVKEAIGNWITIVYFF